MARSQAAGISYISAAFGRQPNFCRFVLNVPAAGLSRNGSIAPTSLSLRDLSAGVAWRLQAATLLAAGRTDARTAHARTAAGSRNGSYSCCKWQTPRCADRSQLQHSFVPRDAHGFIIRPASRPAVRDGSPEGGNVSAQEGLAHAGRAYYFARAYPLLCFTKCDFAGTTGPCPTH